jgi:hypothetical protein
MADLPAIIPSTRVFVGGASPNTTHGTLSGSEIRVKHSNVVVDTGLRLTVLAVDSATIIAVRDHYNGQKGGFLSFAIPDDIFSGEEIDLPDDFTPADYQWVYAARPRIVDIPIPGPTPTNRHDLILEFKAVPLEIATASGARIISRVEFRGGSAELGMVIEAVASFITGGAFSEEPVQAEGFNLTCDVTFNAGAASAESAGINISAITYSQTSVYPGNSAATNATMTNGVSAETLATGLNPTGTQWIQMDFGAVYSVANVVVGSDFANTLVGGWGKTFAENISIEYSSDGSSWSVGGNTGVFSTAIKTIGVSFSARYVRLIGLDRFIAITEFYATST